MIKVTEMKNGLSAYPFYIAEATKMNVRSTGNNEFQALKNLRNEIEKRIKKNIKYM